MTGKPEVNFPIADHPPRVVLRMTNFTPPDKSLAQQVLRQKCSKRLFVLTATTWECTSGHSHRSIGGRWRCFTAAALIWYRTRSAASNRNSILAREPRNA